MAASAFLAAAATFAAATLAGGPAAAADNPLETYRWSERPLLVFGAAAGDATVDRQMTLLADHADGLADRDMAILIVGPDSVFATFGRPAPGATARALRRAFRVPDGAFRAILLGKDGGVKLTDDEPVTADRLFALIDGMPMRQREMRERAGE